MEINLATTEDLPILNELYFACSEDMKARFGLNHWENPYPQETLKRRLSSDMVYKVISNDEFIASFMLEKEYPQPYLDAINEDDLPFRYLTRLAVFPKHQSKGIGSWTLRKAEETAKAQGAEVMRLDILSHYKQLERFYARNGYKEIGTGKTRRFIIEFMEKAL